MRLIGLWGSLILNLNALLLIRRQNEWELSEFICFDWNGILRVLMPIRQRFSFDTLLTDCWVDCNVDAWAALNGNWANAL